MIKYFLILVIALLGISCSEENDSNKVDFDKKAMLESYWNNYISPKINDYDNSINELSESWDAYKLDGSDANYDNLLNHFFEAYKAWQYVGFLNFGPATENGSFMWLSETNIFPSDTSLINQNIVSGDYNLDFASNIDAKGLPALDYLFSLNRIVRNNSEYQSYVSDLISRLVSQSNTVKSEWEAYSQSFISDDGNGRSSSMSLLINSMIQYWEVNLRNGKLGIPIGQRSSSILPEKVESFYLKQSGLLLSESVKAYKEFYKLDNGVGLEEYINAIGNNYSNGELNQNILNQFVLIEDNLTQNPIDEMISSNQGQLEQLYNDIQKMIVYIKVDMPSAMGILITYQDNDGD